MKLFSLKWKCFGGSVLPFLLLSSGAVLRVEATEQVLVPTGAVWKYSTGTDLGTTWREAGFDDSAWPSGPAQLGYGDGDEATIIPSVPINPCYYFRHSLTVGDPSAISGLSLEVLRDDGCVVYLNGEEVARYNMPAGTITYDNWASIASEYTWDPPVSIPNLLVPGDNVIEVEVHQANSTSSDISFDLKLTATLQINVVLDSPAPDQTGVSQPVTLNATATNPYGNNLTVSFYGRPAAAPVPDFTVAVLPDTQKYTAEINGGLNAMFIAQTEWIRTNRDQLNIVYVAHEGDVTENGDMDTDESEWANAADALYPLETYSPAFPDGLPYGVAVGNHDQFVPTGDNDPTTLFNQYFGKAHFAGRSYYGGSFDDKNNNQFQLFSASGCDFVVVYLEYSPSSAALSWADQVLKGYPDRHAIVVSHSLLETTGAWTAPGLAIYDALKGNPNLFLMLCGHNHGEAWRTDVYNGSTVQTLLADYQSDPGGGNGFMRLLTFSPSNGEIRVTTFSPWLDQYETDSDSQFSLPWPVSTGPAFTLLQQNPDVTSGTQTAALWSNLQPGAMYEWYVSASDGTESTSSETRRFTVAANNPPTVTLTSPADGGVYQPTDSITLTAAAGDSDGTVESVGFYDGTTLLGALGAPYPCSLTLNDLAAGNHTFTAVATDDGGAQTISAPVHVFVGLAPVAPDLLAATSVSATEVSLNWRDNSENETGFELFESLADNSYSSLGTVAADTTVATVTDLTPSTTYYFFVSAFNPAGSGDSQPITVRTADPPAVPEAPSGLQATPVSVEGIQLQWTDNSSDETGFVIERSLDGVNWAVVVTTPADTVSWLDTGLASGTVYYYRVSAFNAGGSAGSTAVAAAPFVESYAATELTTVGTPAGSLTDTFVADAQYETLTEKQTGRKSLRTSALEHQWMFDVTPGKSVVFWVKAFHTISSDNDDFSIAWSTDNVTYYPLLTITATADEGYQSASMPSSVQGSLYIRVQDTDRSVENRVLDSLYIDHLFIQTDVSPVSGPPAAPVLNAPVPGDGTVTLTWSAVNGATSYTVWRKAAADNVFATLGSVAGTSFTDTGLVNDTDYQYFVTAVNGFGESDPSNEQACTPSAQSTIIPEPPTSLRANAAKGKLNLSWTQSVTSGVTQNNLYRSEDGANFELLATINAGTTYSDRVDSGIPYTYYVTAVIDAAESAPSNEVTGTAR